MKTFNYIKRISKLVAIAIIVVVITVLCVMPITNSWLNVSGMSMYPTLMDGEQVMGVTYDKTYERGDIIDFFDAGSGEQWVKRVIGVAGDIVEINKETGTVSVNGSVLNENYINTGAVYKESMTVCVPENCLFVMGDNRNHSCDSRVIGCINTANVIRTIIPVRFTD